MYFPNPNTPKTTWISPASRNTIKIAGKAFSKLPSLAAIILAITTILTAVIGAVGPEIWVLVPPNKEAKKLIKIAPYNPALGPNPDDTPKANAKGNATIPAVKPPNVSPLRLLNKPFTRF